MSKSLSAKSLGRFISVEGTEGVGKTTAINHLCDKLQTEGVDFIRTREPGGSDVAEKLRALLLDPATIINEDTELLLMFAARADHLQQTILPALNAGKWVICDRFIDSSIAYQGFGRGNGSPSELAKINSLITQFVPRLPDVSLWLDLPIADGMIRAGKRSSADRFEQEATEFFARVHAGFEYMANQSPKRVVRIDASGTPEQVVNKIWQVLQGLLMP